MTPGSPTSAALDHPRGAVPLTGAGRLPLAFVGAGLFAYGLAACWLAGLVRSDLAFFLHPGVVGLAHLWLPGFLLSVCIGATYQLMPVVLGEALRLRDRWLWGHAALHAVGVAALTAGLAGGRYALAGLGGLAVTLGTGVLATATWRTFRASRRRDAAAWSFVFAAGWLIVTTAAGVLLAINRRDPFLPLAPLDLLRAHAHLGLAGYFASLLQGVTFQLVPMFTLGEARRPRLALAGLLATQAALPVLAAGLAWHASASTALGALGLIVGFAASGSALAATLASRRRRHLEPGVQAFVIGLGLLAIGALAGLALALGPTTRGQLVPFATAYGMLLVGGGLTLAVLGMLAKILPFLVWMRAYGPHVGKKPVPLATALASRRLEKLWLAVHLVGLVAIALGTLLEQDGAAQIGGALLGLAALTWLLNAGRVLRHLSPALAPRLAPQLSPP